PTTCSRRRASLTAPPSCTSASWSRWTRPKPFSPGPASARPKTTFPAASAEPRGPLMDPRPHEHIVRSFDAELARLTTEIAAMGRDAGAQLAAAFAALEQGDTAAARAVIEHDDRIDDRERGI